jgi:hypothetical protein
MYVRYLPRAAKGIKKSFPCFRTLGRKKDKDKKDGIFQYTGIDMLKIQAKATHHL